MRDPIHGVCPGCPSCAETAETYARIVAGQCAPDEQHCGCVPALREEIKRLTANLEDARYFIAKRSRVRVSMRDVWLREKERRVAAEAERDAFKLHYEAIPLPRREGGLHQPG